MRTEELRVEPWREPGALRGKVFAAVFPHSDDFSINACALMLKLLREGCAGYFIRVTNDEMDSFDLTAGETMFRIERETYAVAEFLGIRKVYDLNYKNHYLDHGTLTELRHRLITLFRFLRVDIAIAFDPWGHYEENPDHYLSGMAVEQACWMAGRQLDLPELTDMGLEPHFVRTKYYVARGPQASNLLVDVDPVFDKKLAAVLMHETPMDNMLRQERAADPGCPYADAEQFARATMLNGQPALLGLEHYEKYRCVDNQQRMSHERV